MQLAVHPKGQGGKQPPAKRQKGQSGAEVTGEIQTRIEKRTRRPVRRKKKEDDSSSSSSMSSSDSDSSIGMDSSGDSDSG